MVTFSKANTINLLWNETNVAYLPSLMDRLGLQDAAHLLDLVSRYYPEDRIQPRTCFDIEEICQNLSKP